MKITIEIDEEEMMNKFVQALMDTDKPAVKRLIRGLIHESLLSLNPVTVKKIAEKFIEIESEINYSLEKSD